MTTIYVYFVANSPAYIGVGCPRVVNGNIVYVTGTITNSTPNTITLTGEIYIEDAYHTVINRFTLNTNRLPNFGVIPSLSIITFRYWHPKTDVTQGQIAVTIDFSPCVYITAELYFNLVELKNGCIQSMDNALGGKSWGVTGVTTSQADIDAIMAFAAPLKVGESISGYKYVLSPYASGSFIVKSESPPTVSYTHNTKCYINAPISVSKMGLNLSYSLKIEQSSFSDVGV